MKEKGGRRGIPRVWRMLRRQQIQNIWKWCRLHQLRRTWRYGVLWGAVAWAVLGAAADKQWEEAVFSHLRSIPAEQGIELPALDEARPEPFKGFLELAGAEHTSEGAEFCVEVHLKTPDMYSAIDRIAVSVLYEPDKFQFVGATALAKPAQLTAPGSVRLTLKGGRHYGAADSRNYRSTRISQLRFRAAAAGGSGELRLAEAAFFAGGRRLEVERLHAAGRTVSIHGKESADTNRDGLLTAADLAAAGAWSEADFRSTAARLRIAPYKRVVLIGIDGAGASVRESAPYFDTLHARAVPVGNHLRIPHIRQIVENGAVTYTAKTTLPSSSSANWGAMLTGVDYAKHRTDNWKSGRLTYDEHSPYPTVFKRLREQFPGRKTAAFVNWSHIADGHIEPSAGTVYRYGSDEQVAREFVRYADRAEAYDTSLVFFHFNSVDAAGHRHGWFTPPYYRALSMVDGYVGMIMDALRGNGLLDDTLVLLTADHGGAIITKDGALVRPKRHGQNSPSATTVFIAGQGRTVASAKGKEHVLQGGCTRDLAATILSALGLNPAIGDSHVVPGLFVPQSQENAALAPQLYLNEVKQTAKTAARTYELAWRPGQPGKIDGARGIGQRMKSRKDAEEHNKASSRTSGAGGMTEKMQRASSENWYALHATFANRGGGGISAEPLLRGMKVFLAPEQDGSIKLVVWAQHGIPPGGPFVRLRMNAKVQGDLQPVAVMASGKDGRDFLPAFKVVLLETNQADNA